METFCLHAPCWWSLSLVFKCVVVVVVVVLIITLVDMLLVYGDPILVLKAFQGLTASQRGKPLVEDASRCLIVDTHASWC